MKKKNKIKKIIKKIMFIINSLSGKQKENSCMGHNSEIAKGTRSK